MEENEIRHRIFQELEEASVPSTVPSLSSAPGVSLPPARYALLCVEIRAARRFFLNGGLFYLVDLKNHFVVRSSFFCFCFCFI
jgi:hypothetical protein